MLELSYGHLVKVEYFLFQNSKLMYNRLMYNRSVATLIMAAKETKFPENSRLIGRYPFKKIFFCT